MHGPGCPVCVIPMGRVDDAMWLAEQPDVVDTRKWFRAAGAAVTDEVERLLRWYADADADADR